MINTPADTQDGLLGWKSEKRKIMCNLMHHIEEGLWSVDENEAIDRGNWESSAAPYAVRCGKM